VRAALEEAATAASGGLTVAFTQPNIGFSLRPKPGGLRSTRFDIDLFANGELVAEAEIGLHVAGCKSEQS
jgi:hypothetical protein